MQTDRKHTFEHADSVEHIVKGNPGPSVPYPDVSCRICLEDSLGNDGNLISTCACSGSLKYVHEGCMKEWLNTIVADHGYDSEGEIKKTSC